MRLIEYKQIKETEHLFDNFSFDSNETKNAFDLDEKKYLSGIGFKHKSKGIMEMLVDLGYRVVFEVIKNSKQYTLYRHLGGDTKKWHMPKETDKSDLQSLSNLIRDAGINL